MNKLFTFLVMGSLAFSAAAPALALESTSSMEVKTERGASLKEIRKEFQEVKKESQKKFQEERRELQKDLKEKTKELKETFRGEVKKMQEDFKVKRMEIVQKFVHRQLTARGELVEIKGLTAPTELVIKVSGVWPGLNKKWYTASSTYPAKGQLLTIKVGEKTRLVRRYWGKSSLEEFTVGDAMQVEGKWNEDSIVSANVVKDDSIHVTFRVHNGKIESLDAANQTFVLVQSNSVKPTVKVTSKTKLIVRGIDKPVFADLKIGDRVHVRGIINSRTKQIEAHLVRVIVPKIVPMPLPVPQPTPTPTSTTTSTSTPTPTPTPTTTPSPTPTPTSTASST